MFRAGITGMREKSASLAWREQSSGANGLKMGVKGETAREGSAKSWTEFPFLCWEFQQEDAGGFSK